MTVRRGPRSAEAKKRRAVATQRVERNGRRVACDGCKLLHPPPVCPVGAESVTVPVTLPPHVHRALKDRVAWGERSAWMVRLIRRELDV